MLDVPFLVETVGGALEGLFHRSVMWYVGVQLGDLVFLGFVIDLEGVVSGVAVQIVAPRPVCFAFLLILIFVAKHHSLGGDGIKLCDLVRINPLTNELVL